MELKFTVLLVAASVVFVEAGPVRKSTRVTGGLLTTIDEYPFLAAVLRLDRATTYLQACSGAILHSRTILSAAHCYRDPPEVYRIRVGSSFSNSGGDVYDIEIYRNHPDFNWFLFDNDISLLRTAAQIIYSARVQQVALPGPNYHINTNSNLRIAGWGRWQGQNDEHAQIRHDSQLMMNHTRCREVYLSLTGHQITDNMFCGSWFPTSVQRVCTEDSGGPVLHFNDNHRRYVVAGVTAFNNECGQIRYPGVNTRVSRYVSWIQENI